MLQLHDAERRTTTFTLVRSVRSSTIHIIISGSKKERSVHVG